MIFTRVAVLTRAVSRCTAYSLSRLRGRVGEGAAAARRSQTLCRGETQRSPSPTLPRRRGREFGRSGGGKQETSTRDVDWRRNAGGVERHRNRARRAAPWRGQCGRRADDARAWAASRSGARRRRLAAQAGAAGRQPGERDLAGAARRASRLLRRRGDRPAGRRRSWRPRTRSTASIISPRCAGCCPSATRTRRCSSCSTRPSRASPSRRRRRRWSRGSSSRFSPSSASASISTPARSPGVPPISSTSRRSQDARCRAAPASPGTTGCWRFPHS